MSNPFLDLQTNTAARLAARASLAEIPMVTEELGDVIKRLEASLVRGGIKETAAIAELAEPDAIEFATSGAELAASPGATFCNGDSYSYAVSYVTAEGETGLSELATYNTTNEDGVALRVPVGTAPARVTSQMLWRNAVDAGASFHLLAALDPGTAEYVDAETHAQFTARLDAEIEPPTANNTARRKRGGCAMIIHTPTGAGTGNTRTASEQTITVRVEIYFKLLINNSANGLQKIPLQVLWDVICQMVGWNTGPGQSPVELGNYGVLENNAGELNYFADFQVPVTLTIE
ncbi:MAG: hypothetical protein HC901_00355 [Bdellovibrionaceae bacterium]|nr:hypothetical protein [Pseudobdellovibrionaceae bacterium]